MGLPRKPLGRSGTPGGFKPAYQTITERHRGTDKYKTWVQVADAKAGAAANETSEAATEYEEVTKTRKKTVRLPLKIAGPGLVMPSMTAEQLKVGCPPSIAFVSISGGRVGPPSMLASLLASHENLPISRPCMGTHLQHPA